MPFKTNTSGKNLVSFVWENGTSFSQVVDQLVDYDGATEKTRVALEGLLQAEHEVTVKRNTLPTDDPDRLSDPSTGSEFDPVFWGPQNTITFRGIKVTVTLKFGTTDEYDVSFVRCRAT